MDIVLARMVFDSNGTIEMSKSLFLDKDAFGHISHRVYSNEVMKYQKIVPIEAVQWNGDMAPIIALIGRDLPTFGDGKSGSLRITTLEGDHECQLTDWVCKGIAGELWPCKDNIFRRTYRVLFD